MDLFLLVIISLDYFSCYIQIDISSHSDYISGLFLLLYTNRYYFSCCIQIDIISPVVYK